MSGSSDKARGVEPIQSEGGRIEPGRVMRKGPQFAERRKTLLEPSDLLERDRRTRQIGIAPQERRYLSLAFVGLDRADAIDEATTRSNETGGPVEHLGLESRQHRNVGGAFGPTDVGMPPHGSGGGTWRIEQHRIECRSLEGRDIGHFGVCRIPQTLEV